MRLRMLYSCFGNVAGVAFSFLDWQDFFFKSAFRLLGLFLGSNLGLDDVLSVTGKRFCCE